MLFKECLNSQINEQEAKKVLRTAHIEKSLAHFHNKTDTEAYRSLSTIFNTLLEETYDDLGYEYAFHITEQANMYIENVMGDKSRQKENYEFFKKNIMDHTSQDLVDHIRPRLRNALLIIALASIAAPFFIPAAISTLAIAGVSAAAVAVTAFVGSFFYNRCNMQNKVLDKAHHIKVQLENLMQPMF